MIIVNNGQKYLKVGDKAIPFDEYDKSGRPIIKPTIERIERPGGKIDVVVKVKCLKIKR